MKICRGCNSELPLDDFYKHSQMADGHLNYCKTCVRRRVSSYREAHIEDVRAYDRDRGKRGHGSGAAKLWAINNPDKRRAQRAVGNAVRDGRLQRHNCWCGAKGEAHHPDYAKPLEVVWLCKRHHEQHHRTLDAAAGGMHA